MATLTDEEKIKIRRAIARKANDDDIPIAWVKAAVGDSAQAVEDILASASFRTAVSNAIDTASTPHGVTFTNQEKKWIAALVMEINYVRDVLG